MGPRWKLCSIVVCLFAAPLSAANLVFVPLTPCRVIDSSIAGGIFAAGETRSYTLRGPTTNYSGYGGAAAGCGIPGLVGLAPNKQNTALALALNVAAKNATGKGNFLAFATNHAPTTSSTLNFNGIVTQPVNNGMNIANAVDIAMCDQIASSPCATGDISVTASFGSAFLIVDVVGYFAEGETPTGNANVALGHQALLANTNGTRNTAIGRETLRANLGGAGNTANGAYALGSNTTGDRNTASGVQALLFNTTGAHNTALGGYALVFNVVGNRNTAVGYDALAVNTTGSFNTAVGDEALHSNTASNNTAMGSYALFANTTGYYNTASGGRALYANTTGFRNTANGAEALHSNTIGYRNTANGAFALFRNVVGVGNIALGELSGYDTTGSHNILVGNGGRVAENETIRIGAYQTRAFVAGIRGVTTANANALPVMVDSQGQLGTTSSSLRFKEDVRDMGKASERILKLRPVTFRYKQELRAGDQPREYGLIAEEVAAVFPELAVYGRDGKPETVKYHDLPALLLNELQRQLRVQSAQVAAQSQVNADLRRELEVLRRQVEALSQGRDEVSPGE